MISVKVTKIWLFVKDKKRKNTHHNKNYTCKGYGQKGRKETLRSRHFFISGRDSRPRSYILRD